MSRGVNEQKLNVIYNGIDFMEYSALPEYFSIPLKICCVGNLLISKNQIVLLKALNHLQRVHPDFDYECDLFGEGETHSKLQEYINKHQLDKVQLKGFCDNVRSRLNKYAVYVQPSRYESFGIAVLEAMNAGCCVLASNVGGLKEIVTDSCGYLFTLDDYQVLAELLYQCFQNRYAIQQKGMKSILCVKRLFNVKFMSKEIQKYYQTVLLREN